MAESEILLGLNLRLLGHLGQSKIIKDLSKIHPQVCFSLLKMTDHSHITILDIVLRSIHCKTHADENVENLFVEWADPFVVVVTAAAASFLGSHVINILLCHQLLYMIFFFLNVLLCFLGLQLCDVCIIK